MPIEIKELIIKANVVSGEGTGSQTATVGSDREEIINACVEQVMKILRREKER